VADGREQLKAMVGEKRGPSEWLLVDQERVNAFAEATEDRQWIHIDEEAAKNGPFGHTIAHGYLTLSLLPMLQRELWTFVGAAMGVNYGLDKLRFPSPVKVGARVRLSVKVLDVEERPDGSRLIKNQATIEVEGSAKPACIAHTLALVVPSPSG